MMDSHKKRLSTPVVKFMTTGVASPTPMEAHRSKSFDGHTPFMRSYRNASNVGPKMHHGNFTTAVQDANKSRGSMTPLKTPNNNFESHVALTPSRTLSESLTSLASSTAEQLERIWNRVGYTPEERATQLSDLLIKMQDLCEQKIAEENGVAVTYEQTIADIKEEMQVTCAALKRSPDRDLLKDNDGTISLINEMQALEAAMENIREAATAAKKELLECRDYIIEAHEALGVDMDPQWRDVESDLTPARREEFHMKKAEMKDELATRSAAVIHLVRDCQHLMNDICIDAENGSELDKQIMGSIVRSKDGSFIMTSKFRTSSCVGLSASALDELTKRVADLDAEKRRRKKLLQEMGSEIATLWEKLHIPEEEQLSFIESVQGLGMSTIARGEAELKRLNKLKATMLDKLIFDARTTIQSLWGQIDAPRSQRDLFEAFKVPEAMFTDDLLDEHEEYITVLQTRLEEMKPIMRLIERREEILRERMEYEELQKDPERLQQRGASMTQQLMKEEKMARRIKKELPKLTESLLYQLTEWKEKHGEDFQYSGRIYLDVMDEQEEEWQEYKANEFQRKQMKKKEEMAMATENRFQPFGQPRKHAIRPLGDARTKENARVGMNRTKSGLVMKGVHPRDASRARADTLA